MKQINLADLDLKTLEFCKNLAWQEKFSCGIGRSNVNRRAEAAAFEHMENLFGAYIQKATELQEQK